MGIKSKEFAQIIVDDIYLLDGEEGLKQLQADLTSPNARQRSYQLERSYTGKDKARKPHPALKPYAEAGGEQYIPFEQLEDALLAVLAVTLANPQPLELPLKVHLKGEEVDSSLI